MLLRPGHVLATLLSPLSDTKDFMFDHCVLVCTIESKMLARCTELD